MKQTSAQGQQLPESGTTPFLALDFAIRQVLGRVNTAKLVKVVAVTNAGEVTPVGFVDVQPLVNQVDGAFKAQKHGVIYGLPYIRVQGGKNAIIIDPQIGDIGLAVICDRDISSVKENKNIANPGSHRKFSLSDGIYVGGTLNETPIQYIQFTASGVTILSPQAVTVTAPVVTVNATTSATINTTTASIVASASATIQATSIVLRNAGSALHTLLNSTLLTWLNAHVHSNGNGGANTGAPTSSPAGTTQTSTVQAE